MRGGLGLRRFAETDRKKVRVRDISRKDLDIIFHHARPHLKSLVIVIITMALVSLIRIFEPLVTKVLVDDCILTGNSDGVIILALVLVAMHGMTWLLHYVQTYLAAKVSQDIVMGVRRELYERIVSSSLRFHASRRKGELLSILTGDVEALSNAFTSGLVTLVNDVLSLGGIVVVMFLLDVPLTIVSLIVVPLLVLFLSVMMRRIRHAFVEVRRKIALLNAKVEENIAGMRVIQALSVESRQNRDFSDLSELNFQATMKAMVSFAVLFAVVSVNSFIAIALVIGFGGVRYIQQAITLGVLIAFFQYITHFIQPIRDIVFLNNTFQEAFAALLHVSETMNHPAEIPDPDDPVLLPVPARGRVELRNVSFSYGEAPFIEGLDFVIDAGERVGIVGETGAGKSTLINLITRLYDVSGGAVLLDGVDVRAIGREDFRRNLAVVSQDVMIFAGTIKTNIKFGRPGASDADVVEAARLANAHGFIDALPRGYDTELGERGAGLSGGQKQLVAYARLLLARPAVAILDEATSNIDSYTESLIQQNMRAVLSSCTTIIIAHRFATLKAVDRLILIKDGRVVDSGSHEALYARDEYYHKLFDEQFSKQ